LKLIKETLSFRLLQETAMFKTSAPAALALVCLSLLAGCAMRVTTAAPAFGSVPEAQQEAQGEAKIRAWWQTYGEEPRGP
jgi:hypothetical protein